MVSNNEFPDWCIAEVVEQIKKEAEHKDQPKPKGLVLQLCPAGNKMFEKGVEAGERNQARQKLASFYKQQGMKEDKIFKKLCEFNKNCPEPIDENKIKADLKEVLKRDYRIGCSTWKDHCGYGNKKECSYLKQFKELLKAPEEHEKKIIEDSKKKDFGLVWVEKYKSYIVDVEEVANWLCDKYDFITLAGKKRDVLWIYNGKFYEQTGRQFIRETCEKILGKYAKNNPLNEITSKVERRNYQDSKIFDEIDINLLPLKNGVFNLKTKKIEPHNPEKRFTTILPINYDAEAKCPVWLNFVSEAIYPEDVPVLQEWFGFNLYRKYLIKKALICLGDTDTGKTVMLDSLTGFVGEENKTGISLQNISSSNDFTKLFLRRKYSNIYDDLSSKDMSDGGNFKVATGGGYISAEEKFGDYAQFKNYAKHTFATNKIPPVKDTDDMAYYSRWIIIRFDNTPKEMDLFLKEKILKEKDGIFNWALVGLYRLLKTGCFSYKKTPEEVRKMMEMSGDPLIQFGEAVLEKEAGARISKEDMYEVYILWANEEEKPLLSKEQLGRNLNQKVTYLVPKKDKERFWANGVIKEEWVRKLDKKKKMVKQKTINEVTIDV